MDYATTINYLHVDPNIVQFVQEGLLDDTGAYVSPLVGQLRFYFVLKASIFQVLLQALIYSPQLQLTLMLVLELIYILGPIVKYKAVSHLKKFMFLLHISGQSTLLIIFLSLVLGMTFKGYKYGNGSTVLDYDPGKWEYGQYICILVVTIAVLAELVIFLAAMFFMLKEIAIMIIGSFTTPKTSSDVSAEKLKKVFVSYKKGVFYTFVDKDAIAEKALPEQGGTEKKKNKARSGPQIPRRLTKESNSQGALEGLNPRPINDQG